MSFLLAKPIENTTASLKFSKSMIYEDNSLINGIIRIQELTGDFKPIIDKLFNKFFK